jgi:hypothetical protein
MVRQWEISSLVHSDYTLDLLATGFRGGLCFTILSTSFLIVSASIPEPSLQECYPREVM